MPYLQQVVSQVKNLFVRIIIVRILQYKNSYFTQNKNIKATFENKMKTV